MFNFLHSFHFMKKKKSINLQKLKYSRYSWDIILKITKEQRIHLFISIKYRSPTFPSFNIFTRSVSLKFSENLVNRSARIFFPPIAKREREEEREKGGKKRGKGGSGFLRSVPFNYPSVFYFKKPPPPFSRTMTFRIPLAING